MVDTPNNSDSPLDQIDVHRIIYALKKAVPFILVTFIFCGILGYLSLRWTKPMYASSSIIKLDVKNDASILGIQSNPDDNRSKLVGEMEIIKSDIIFEKLLASLDLSISYFEKGNILVDEHYHQPVYSVVTDNDSTNQIIYDQHIYITFIDSSLFKINLGTLIIKKHYFGELINIKGFKFRIFKTSNFSNKAIGRELFFKIHSYQWLKKYFSKNLLVSIENGAANTLNIAFRDYNPTKAVDVTSTIVSVYKEQTLHEKRKIQEQTIAFINEQLKRATEELRLAEKDIESFVVSTGLVSPINELSGVKAKMEEYENLRLTLEQENYILDEVYKFVTSDQSTEKFIPVIDNLESGNLSNSILSLNELNKQLELIKGSNHENTMAYKNKLIEIQTIKQTILESIFQNQRLLKDKMFDLKKNITELEIEFATLPSKETELTRLKRYFDLWEKFYLMLINKKVEYGIQMAGTTPEFIILEPATLPSSPISPNKLMFIIGPIAGGFFLSIIIAFVFYLKSNLIMSKKDISNKTNVPILGEIPLYTKASMAHSRVVIQHNPKFAISEAFRNVRTNINYIIDRKEKFVVATTSTIGGEGKTFITINTAAVLALSGKKVVVLDLDLRKPKIHLAFDAANSLGMSNILIGQNNYKDCVQKSEVENLCFIPSGVTPPNPSELILRGELTTLLDELHEEFDVIMLDTPPVGLVTDAKLVFDKADALLYIAKAKYSKLSMLKDIQTLYSSNKVTQMGIILNASNRSSSSYGYGYGYGYYEDEPKTTFSFLKKKA